MSGYSGTPLWKKLGYKSEFNVKLVNAPSNYMDLVDPLPEDVIFTLEPPFHLVHIFTNSIEEVENQLSILQNEIVQNGMIWASWYKRASGKQTEVNEDLIRNTALSMRLVDVKVCSVNQDWSALKLVIPVKYRK